jgi:hypothetical protein
MAFNSASVATWLLAAVLTSGCGGAFEDKDLATLKTRAAFDFQCPKDDIKTVTIDDSTKGVTGCGQRATYVQTYGRWILNSDSKRSKKDRSEDGE